MASQIEKKIKKKKKKKKDGHICDAGEQMHISCL